MDVIKVLEVFGFNMMLVQCVECFAARFSKGGDRPRKDKTSCQGSLQALALKEAELDQ
jgi:hypothetical protein